MWIVMTARKRIGSLNCLGGRLFSISETDRKTGDYVCPI